VIFLHLIRKRKKQKNHKTLSLLVVVAVREAGVSLRTLAKRLIPMNIAIAKVILVFIVSLLFLPGFESAGG
jgi:hypothetical protein